MWQGRRYLARVEAAAAATARESLLRERCQFPESNLGRGGGWGSCKGRVAERSWITLFEETPPSMDPMSPIIDPAPPLPENPWGGRFVSAWVALLGRRGVGGVRGERGKKLMFYMVQ